MKEITILLFTRKRPSFNILTANMMKNLKHENKQVIHLMIMGTGQPFEHYHNIFGDVGVSYDIINDIYGLFQNITHSVHNCKTKYCLRLDEDAFVSSKVLDFIIENRNILDDDKNLCIASIFSNGIPTTESYIEQLFNEEQVNDVYNDFIKTPIPNMWGVNYSSLNNLGMNKWEPRTFYDAVSKINHYYKGIHPVRINGDIQFKINEYTNDNIEKFCNPKELSFFEIEAPYFCNGFFLGKTETYRAILNDRSLFRDDVDEVAFNIYRERYNLKILYVKNGFGMHPMYNTVHSPENDAKELEFFSRFKGKFIDYNKG